MAEPKDLSKRPECPIDTPFKQNLARYEYKLAMIEYISQFGYTLKYPAGNYPTAFLEALANYCEERVTNAQKITDGREKI